MSSSLHKFRFPRSSRLKSPSVIRRVFRDGSQLRGGEYSVHWRSNTTGTEGTASPTRLAFVVSKRLGKAHVRNRIKRRLREAARLNQEHWPSGADLVIRAKENRIAAMEFTTLSQSLQDSLRKIGARLK